MFIPIQLNLYALLPQLFSKEDDLLDRPTLRPSSVVRRSRHGTRRTLIDEYRIKNHTAINYSRTRY